MNRLSIRGVKHQTVEQKSDQGIHVVLPEYLSTPLKNVPVRGPTLIFECDNR